MRALVHGSGRRPAAALLLLACTAMLLVRAGAAAAAPPNSVAVLEMVRNVMFGPGTYTPTAVEGSPYWVRIEALDDGNRRLAVSASSDQPLQVGVLYEGPGAAASISVPNALCNSAPRFVIDELQLGAGNVPERVSMRVEVWCDYGPPFPLHAIMSWNATQQPHARSYMPTVLALRGVLLGGDGLPSPVTLTNEGTQPLPVHNVRTDSPRFQITSTTCANVVLAPSATCTTFVRADPAIGWPTAATGHLIVEDHATSLSPGTGGTVIPLSLQMVFPVEYPEGQFTSVTPQRVYDSRGGPQFASGEARVVPIAGRAGIPATGAAAVVLNVTATNPRTSGYLTVWPSGVPQPPTSNLNFVAGRTVPNMVIAALGADGAIRVFAEVPTDVLVDVVGFFSGPTGPRGSFFRPFDPLRWFDTRTSPRADGIPRRIGPGDRVIGSVTNGAPSAEVGLDSIAMNVTAIEPTASAFLTVAPEGSPSTASSLNYFPGQVVPNAVISPVSADRGAIDFRNSAGEVDIAVDIVGGFDDGTDASVPATRFRALPAPVRVADSRVGYWQETGYAGPVYGRRPVRLGGVAIPSTAKAAVLNVTVVATSPGYLAVVPSGQIPETSSLNYATNHTVANTVTTKLSAHGVADIVPSALSFRHGIHIEVIVDVFGWFE